MGDLGVILLILYLVFMKKNNRDRSNSDFSKLITRALIAMFILGIISPLLDSLFVLGIFGAAGYYIYKKYQSQREKEKRANKYGWSPNRWDKDKEWKSTGSGYGQSSYGQPGSGNRQGSYSQANYGQPGSGNRQGNYTQANYGQPGSGNRQGSYSQPGSGNRQGNYNQATYGQSGSGNRQGSYSQTQRPTSPLPKLVKKRRKIVADFNNRYNLYLTDEQISSIVNSSYMSEIWRHELEAMNCKYDSIYQWFTGPTNWLRVYMYAFHVQEITSDIQQQEDICMYSFESIFSYVDTLTNLSQSQKIRMVNEKYFTSFDDVSFMVAYRFLERKGLNHDLRNPDLAHNMSDDADDLVNKYMSDPADDLVQKYMPDDKDDLVNKNVAGGTDEIDDLVRKYMSDETENPGNQQMNDEAGNVAADF